MPDIKFIQKILNGTIVYCEILSHIGFKVPVFNVHISFRSTLNREEILCLQQVHIEQCVVRNVL